MTRLEDLPAELLYDIFVHSRSESFPHISRYVYLVVKHAPLSIQVEYLVSRSLPTDDLPSRILRFPICTLPVLETLFRIPFYVRLLSSHCKASTKLPRRLFQNFSPKPRPRVVGLKRQRQKTTWTTDDEPIPLLRFLLEHPRIPDPDWDHRDGYPLAKAVMAGFIPLVRFLLENGASPACKDGLAVRVAITRKDLKLVRMLIEPDASVRDQDGRAVRRRKIEDRVKPDSEMLKTAVRAHAMDIVEYLLKEKGCVPDMPTVLMLSRTG